MVTRKISKAEKMPDTAMNQAALKWFNLYRVRAGNTYEDGYVLIPVECIDHPEKCIEAREQDKDHRADMKNYFKTHGVLEPNIKVLMWSDEKFDKVIRFDIDLDDPRPPSPIYAIVGDHSAGGLKDLTKDYPKNRKFKYVLVKMAICPKTEENIKMALHYGTLDNTIASLHKAMSMWDCCKQMRNRWMDLCQEFPYEQQKNEKRKKWKHYLTNCETSMPFSGGTYHTLAVVAKYDVSIWKLISKIFEGEYVKNPKLKGQTTPKSFGHFNEMGGIPNEDLIRWLERVVNGTWTTKIFNNRCQLYKKTVRVRADIVEFVNTIRPEHGFEDFDKVAMMYPKMADPNWWNGVISWVSDKKKEKLSALVKQQIEDIIEQTEKKEEETQVINYTTSI